MSRSGASFRVVIQDHRRTKGKTMMNTNRVILVMGLAFAALASERAASAKSDLFCTVESFTFDSVKSVVGEVQNNGTRVVEYVARGTTLLSGAGCPFDGHIIHAGMAGAVTY